MTITNCHKIQAKSGDYCTVQRLESGKYSIGSITVAADELEAFGLAIVDIAHQLTDPTPMLEAYAQATAAENDARQDATDRLIEQVRAAKLGA